MVATAVAGDFLAALVIAAGLAALMSTMDSQLLTLSSIFTRDILPLMRRSQTTTSLPGRLFVIGLSLAGLGFAYRPPATILQIATAAFTGLAVLFPTVFFGLYCSGCTRLRQSCPSFAGKPFWWFFIWSGFQPAFFCRWCG